MLNEQTQESGSRQDKPTILIVDDRPQNLALLEAYLVPEGYAIIKATNGEEALNLLASRPIDLILLDIIMPGLNGLEVTRRVKQDKNLRLLPIILLTALKETKDRVAGIEAGCDDFISKPIDKSELLARVRSLLKVKAYHDLTSNYRQKLETEVSRKTEDLRKNLQGSIKLLADILLLANPEAFNTAQLARKLIRSLCNRLQVNDAWEYEIAAMLCQTGILTLPPDIIDKYRKNKHLNKKEQVMFKGHPAIARKLINNIPKMEGIAEAVSYQLLDFPQTLEIGNKHTASMARMLALTLNFVSAVEKSGGRELEIIADFQQEKNKYDPEMLVALESELTNVKKNFIIREISRQDIAVGMVLADDIRDGVNNMLILPKGTEITEIMQVKIANFLTFDRTISKIKILERVGHQKS